MQSLEPNSNGSAEGNLTVGRIESELTSTRDAEFKLGNFSLPTVTESRASSVKEQVRTSSQAAFGSTETEDYLTLGAALLGLLGVVQLHLVVRSRHVHSNTQRLDEGIFNLIELGPDPGLRDPKTGT